MAKRFVSEEEWWPVYDLIEDDDFYTESELHELPDDLIARHEATSAAFRAVQREIKEAITPGPVLGPPAPRKVWTQIDGAVQQIEMSL